MAGRIVVETERLILREFDEKDVASYYLLGSDLVVVQYTGCNPLENLEQAAMVLRSNPLSDYLKHGYGRWACILKSNNDFIGFAGLKWLEDLDEVDVGFWLRPAFWRQGFATEAGRAALDYGFDCLKLQRIIGLVDSANLASVRVLEKLGMTCVGTIAFNGEPAIKYSIESPQRKSSAK